MYLKLKLLKSDQMYLVPDKLYQRSMMHTKGNNIGKYSQYFLNFNFIEYIIALKSGSFFYL